jgi:hypothetical protein
LQEESASNSVTSSEDHEVDAYIQIAVGKLAPRVRNFVVDARTHWNMSFTTQAAQDPELQEQFDSVPMLSGDLDAMHEA